MDVVRLTRDLVRFNSSSALSNADISDCIRRQLGRMGFETELVTYEQEGVKKVNVIGRKGKGRGGLAFLSHSDTVPADGWAGPGSPFKATVKTGRIYGRGSADMKGPIACLLCAAERFSTSLFTPPLTVVVTSDEETGCRGAKVVASSSGLFRETKARYGIITEPTMLGVVHAHKGVIRLVATARGRAAHSSTGKGFNAHLRMIPFLHDMWKMYYEITTNRAYFNEAFDPPFSDWNLTINDADTPSNVTVPISRVTINFRPMPGQDVASILGRVQDSARERGVHLQKMVFGGPFFTSPESRIVKEAVSVTRRTKLRTVPYATDGMVFGRYLEAVVLGPGDIRQAHTHDEWVQIDQLRKGVEVYSNLIRRFCVEGGD